jgi:uncharacterized protein YndB with AHSA1/START domain
MRSGIAGGPAESGFELQRRFRASPERVFEAWTRPAALREWWCPSGWIAREVDIDLRIGGFWRIAMMRASNREDVSVSGRFLEVKPPERLVFTLALAGRLPGDAGNDHRFGPARVGRRDPAHSPA